MVFFLVLAPSSVALPATNEQTLTVAFLYNFLKFAEWPETVSGSEISICMTDSSFLGEELKAIEGRSARNKTVHIKTIDLGESPITCQLLFLPREEKPIRVKEWLRLCENLPILTVANSEDFLQIGGMVMLVDDGSRLQFEVNLEPVRKAGLKLNAQLLGIARNVLGK